MMYLILQTLLSAALLTLAIAMAVTHRGEPLEAFRWSMVVATCCLVAISAAELWYKLRRV